MQEKRQKAWLSCLERTLQIPQNLHSGNAHLLSHLTDSSINGAKWGASQLDNRAQLHKEWINIFEDARGNETKRNESHSSRSLGWV